MDLFYEKIRRFTEELSQKKNYLMNQNSILKLSMVHCVQILHKVLIFFPL